MLVLSISKSVVYPPFVEYTFGGIYILGVGFCVACSTTTMGDARASDRGTSNGKTSVFSVYKKLKTNT